MVDSDDQRIYDSVLDGYSTAQIDYETLYIRLYIVFNTWYRRVTGSTNDAEAIARLKERFVIWSQYLEGKTMIGLGLVMTEAGLDTTDWRGLIDYWYSVRCEIIHGMPKSDNNNARIAYMSLNIYLSEIVSRMKRSLNYDDNIALKNPQNTPNEILYAKFIYSSDPWVVDMLHI